MKVKKCTRNRKTLALLGEKVANDEFGRFDIKPDGSFKVKAKVTRDITPLKAFKGITSHRQYFLDYVFAGMPLGTEEEVILHFFSVGRYLSFVEYEAELECRRLKPDPMGQAAYNSQNPTFVDKFPNGTQWRNSQKKYCCVGWDFFNGRPEVNVGEGGGGWSGRWFACGVSK